jgi:hypothetical protein
MVGIANCRKPYGLLQILRAYQQGKAAVAVFNVDCDPNHVDFLFGQTTGVPT